MNTEKLIATSKKLYTFFKILRKIVVIGMSVALLIMALITVIHAIDPSVLIGEDFASIDIGPLSIQLTPEYAPSTGNLLTYSWLLMLLGAVCAGLIYYALGIVLQILAPMTQGQPFAPSVGEDIRKMSYICLAMGIVLNIAHILDTANAMHVYRISELIDHTQIVSITANYQVDLTFLVLFFVLLLMSHIFHYGAQLQQLSDETL